MDKFIEERYAEIEAEFDEGLRRGSGPKPGSKGAAPPAVQDEKGLVPLREFSPGQIMAQRLMAMVVDPETGGPLTKTRIAELVGVSRERIWNWINNPRTGGPEGWYRAVDKYVGQQLMDEWPMLVRVQRDQALKGKNPSVAFRNIASILGRLGPETVVDASRPAIHAQVILRLPDNGRGRGQEEVVEVEEAPEYEIEEGEGG